MRKPGTPSLARAVGGQLCSGCGLCAALAPGALEMRLTAKGFLRPAETGPVPHETDARIARLCPGLGLSVAPEGRRDHPLWGPHVAMHSGYATDPALRHAGSSGGALSAILAHLLESGAVDAVIQVGADPALPIGNRTVMSRDAADVLRSAGSRYAPSAPLAEIGECLASDLTYAFVGKPCDVAALRALEREDRRISERIPWLLTFFCAGVPSLHGAREVVARLGVAERDLAAFRYRGNGWPGHATATRRDGTEARMSYAESWGGILSRHLQFRCKICPDGTGGFADVVCADAWETDARGYPLFEEREGVSLVMSRTARGEALVRAAEAGGRLALAPFDAAALEAMQPGQTQRRRFALARLLALRLVWRPAPRYRGFHLLRNALRAGLRGNLRNFLGTLRRAALDRL